MTGLEGTTSKELTMRFGLLCSAQAGNNELGPETGQGFRDYLDFNVEAEALGYHSSFSVEHHFTGWNQVSATLTLLTCLAMRTTTLRLGTAVMVLPWHNPVLLAEQAATLDLISGGRLDFGIGKGYRHSEFKGFGIPQEEAEARFEEAIEVILRVLDLASAFSHHGRYWQFEDIVVEPPTAQRPHPPFWVAAASPSSIRRAAASGFNLILDQYAGPRRDWRTHRALPIRTRSQGLHIRSDAGHGGARNSTSRKTRPTKKPRWPGKRNTPGARSRYRERLTATPVLMSSLTPTPSAQLSPTPFTERRTKFATCSTALNKAGAEYVLLTISGGAGAVAALRTRNHAGILLNVTDLAAR